MPKPILRSSALALLLTTLLGACASTTHDAALRGTGDMGVIIERAAGKVQIVENSSDTKLGEVTGLGDLSHAHVVFSRDARYAYVFGRDGGLSKVDLLTRTLAKRVVQAGNSIGGSISQDGRLIVAQNYDPGGVKVFSADTLEQLADIPATYGSAGARSKVVGLADLPGNRFVYALFDAGEIWVVDLKNPRQPQINKYANIGKQPYDGLATQDGRYFMAGLFGEDGIALLDLWNESDGVKRILANYGKGEEKLPVYKMPHLRGWSVASGHAFLPAIGRNEVLVANTSSWQEAARIPVYGQPVFVMAEPTHRRVWVNFAFPHNDTVQVIDVPSRKVIKTLKPGKAVLHMEFTGRGDELWLSSRDDNTVVIYDTSTLEEKKRLPANNPSGIFFTWRANRIGM
ncbi:MAG: cytochrome D1 domain-containing protein [Burkholderiales bacterium]